jgi:raffinose/stachyose/melibiose transport system substrate-binding protein
MKKALTGLALVLVAALVLGACSSQASRDRGGAANLPTKTAGAYPSEDVTLTMWWWGEQEAPGAKEWLAQAIDAYKREHENVTIKTVLQTTDGLIPGFQAAAAAKEGPDIQYFWGGIYSQQPAWAGQILPISDYLPADELHHYINANTEDTYRDKVLTAPWYVNPQFPVLVRTDVLDAHGLTVPKTWDEFLNVCDTLSKAGVTTIAGGVKDGWFGGWLYSMLGVQSLSSPGAVTDAVIGDQKFTDPKQAEWWTKLQESKQHGCWNSDINSLELYQAQQQWVDGKAAMTVTAGTDAPRFVNQVGADKVVVTTMPVFAEGPYAGRMGTTSQTVGITEWTKYPQVAADFIKFMHSPEQLAAWYERTGTMPADDRFDISAVKDPVQKQLFELARNGAPYIENFLPADLDSGAIFTNVQLVLGGSKTADQAAADVQAQMERLRSTDPSMVANFKAWRG